jgi:hypothetical protein
MKQLNNLITSLAVLLVTLASCINYDDAGRLVNVQVHLKTPADFKAGAALDNQEVKIKSKTVELKAMTDENGIATFEGCMPDVYNISSYVELTGEEYAEKTGSQDPVEECIITATLNEQLFDETREQLPIEMESAIMAITPKDPGQKTKSIVISKIYSSGSKYNGNKNYLAGRYIELFNQSDQTADVAGMYIGLLESTGNSNRVYTLEELKNDPSINGTMVVVKQVYRIPTDKEYLVEGGKSIVITNSAIDHSSVNQFEADLSTADFEVVDYNDQLEHNDNVVKLSREFYAISSLKGMNLMQGGPCGIILFETDEDINSWPTTYGYGKTSGSMVYLLVPNSTIKDGVDFVKNTSTGPNLSTKRLYDEIDAGCTHIEAINGYTGEVVYRKTARVYPDGRKKLMDTNNSSNDFKVSTTIKPREYDEE